MPYTPTDWSNEAPAGPLRFNIRDNAGTLLQGNVQIELITSVTAGTPLNSTNMNKIEEGIETAQATAEAQRVTADLVDGILSADTTGRAKMADGFITLAKLSAALRFEKLFEFEGNGSANFDWNSIPGTFTHLLMIYTGVSSRTTAGYDDLYIRVNNDTAANYNTAVQSFVPNTARWNWGITNPHDNGLLAGALPAQNAGYLPAGSGLVLFPDYAGTTFYKSCIQFSAYYGTYGQGVILSNSYRANAAAITRLTGNLNGDATYFPRAGSIFSLYGFN